MRTVSVCAAIASSFQAYLNCKAKEDDHWQGIHAERIENLTHEFLPHGSGFDWSNGADFDFSSSRMDRLVFRTAFHHMNENGYYDGWTEHNVIVTPAFDGFDIRVTGRNRNDIREYIAECFHHALSQDAPMIGKAVNHA